MQRFVSRKFIITGFIIFILAGMSLTFIADISQPVRRHSEAVLLDIPKGCRFVEIADILQRNGLIRNKISFSVLALFWGVVHQIKAGEYEITTDMSPLMVLNKLITGDIKVYRMTIPEDLTAREIAERLSQAGLIDRKDFDVLSRDKDFLQSMHIEGETVEGYLYPETYYFNRSMDTKRVMQVMIGEFWKRVTPELQDRAGEMGLSVHDWITLASLIGKETGYADEKTMVSAVFHNRLKRGMKLQSDPTAVYHLDSLNGPIRRKHLSMPSRYNTYHIGGLPPGPIANPGIDSLMAALFPAKVNYLYFVAKNDGSHHFSTNYSSHYQAVRKYQVNEKK